MGPGVVSSKHNPLAAADQLVNEVVLGNLVGPKVARHVNEGGETPSGEALQPLHGGGGRVGHEPVQLAGGNTGAVRRGRESGEDWQPVLAVTRL